MLAQAMTSMQGDPLVAVVREVLMNPITIPQSPAYLALRREIEAIEEARGVDRSAAARVDAGLATGDGALVRVTVNALAGLAAPSLVAGRDASDGLTGR